MPRKTFAQGGAIRLAMDRPGEQLLPRSRFAEEEDRGVGGRDALDGVRHLHDPRRLADDRRQAMQLLELFLQQEVLVAQLAVFAAAAQDAGPRLRRFWVICLTYGANHLSMPQKKNRSV